VDTFPRCRKDRAAKCGRERRDAGFSYARGRSAAVNDINVSLVGSFVHPRDGIGVEIGLINGFLLKA
jgi:hypothetical protein